MPLHGHQRNRWRSIRDFFGDAPAWLLLGTLVYVPWDYGGTHARSVFITETVLAVTLLWWVIAWLVLGRRIAIPPLLFVAGLMIAAEGWFAVWNARSFHDPDYQTFIVLAHSWSGFPSSVDAAISLQSMLRVTLLIGVIWFVAALVADRVWVTRLWMTIAVAGGSIAALGLLQRMTGAVLPFWQYQPWLDHFTFFATYYYHGNAGAFLNLVLPPAFGLALRTLSKSGAPVQKALWTTAAVLIIAAVIVNTSRMAQALGLVAAVASLLWPGRRQALRLFRENRTAFIAIAAVTLVVISTVADVSIIKPTQRWRYATHEVQSNARWWAYGVATHALADIGLFGFGPGTFAAAFSHYEAIAGSNPKGEWQHLHQDYLQTLLEWGWFGGACWAAILFGGLASAVVALRRTRPIRPPPRISRFLPLILIALGVTAIHSLVDFPLQVLSLQLIVATYLGLCWGARRAIAEISAPASVRETPANARQRIAGVSKL